MRGGKRAGSGRPAGVKDSTPRGEHKTLSARACAIHGIDPFEVAAMIAKGELPCMVCRGKGKTKYQAGARGNQRAKLCEARYGSGERRSRHGSAFLAAKFLCHYQAPKLKATEHTGPEGGSPCSSTPIRVRFVRAGCNPQRLSHLLDFPEPFEYLYSRRVFHRYKAVAGAAAARACIVEFRARLC